MNPDAKIGTCNWEACSQCKYHNTENGCNRVLEPAMEVHHGDVYCCDFEYA